jgi:class 3 adenylate cyclase
MAIADDLKTEVARIFRDNWDVRDGRVVPAASDVTLSNDAIKFDRATVLYADLDGSTAMVQGYKWYFAAEIYRTYLFCAAKLIRDMGGSVTAYDGDRVMGIFIGNYQSSNAVKCGLKINHAVQMIINPAIKQHYGNTEFQMKQVVGIDTSPIHVARTGVRGDNDLVWVGRAANYAAKLTDLSGRQTWITKDVFEKMNDEVKFHGQAKTPMWEKWRWDKMNNYEIYSSIWRWVV